MARDGWLSIQHGKPTRVNNVWETSGLNFLETLIRLDGTRLPSVIEGMLSARSNISIIYIQKAFKIAPQASLDVFSSLEQLADNAQAYIDFDYDLFRKLAFVSGNPIYGLILNSFKSLYMRVGLFYFSDTQARELAKQFYLQLKEICERGAIEEVSSCIRQYGKDSGAIWFRMQESLLADFNG